MKLSASSDSRGNLGDTQLIKTETQLDHEEAQVIPTEWPVGSIGSRCDKMENYDGFRGAGLARRNI